MRALPDFDTLRKNYPDDDPDTVKSNIGGAVDAAWITNTCAIRMSRAFNYSGVPLPPKFTGLNVVSGSDKMWYAYRQQELRRWIRLNFGGPAISKNRPAKGHIDRSDFASAEGVIAFDIHFGDATGHIGAQSSRT
jgi:type VI secretion system (T6SS) effector Tae4 (amidase)